MNWIQIGFRDEWEALPMRRRAEGRTRPPQPRLGILVIAAWACFAAAPAQSGGPEPLGMVLSVKGEAHLVREAAAPVRLGDMLRAGDILEVVSGDLAFIFCPEGRRYQLSAGGRVSLSTQAAAFTGPAPQARAAGPCSLPKVRLGAESLERVGGLRPRGRPPIPVYVGGVISTGNPVFDWKPVPEATAYVVAVTREDGNRVWEGTVSGPPARFPGDSLTPGWYDWSVRAERNNEVLAEQNTGLEVRPAPAGSTGSLKEPLLEAFRLEDLGYHAEAAGLLRKLVEEDPADGRLRRRLAWLYWKAGLLPAFNHELEILGKSETEAQP